MGNIKRRCYARLTVQSIVAHGILSLSFSLSLNICTDNLKASNTLSYDVASLSSFPKSSLIVIV